MPKYYFSHGFVEVDRVKGALESTRVLLGQYVYSLYIGKDEISLSSESTEKYLHDKDSIITLGIYLYVCCAIDV